jgi:glycosyltransferase involved in cell wall biosynthesis
VKIVLVTDYFYPTSKGGTEKYVYLLAKHLIQSHSVTILSSHPTLQNSVFEDLTINYIPPNTDYSKNVIKGKKAPNNILHFKEYLQKIKPDVLHLHTLTTNFNHYHTLISYDLGIKTFFTSHIPGHQCLRGDFIYKGKKPCDGKIERGKCTSCFCFSSNISPLRKITKYLYYNLLSSNPVDMKIRQLQLLQKSNHKIIAVCNWQKEFLNKNGIHHENLDVCRQEVSNKKIIKTNNHNKIRLGFLGRIDPFKGLDLLLKALVKINNDNISLSIAAIYPSIENQRYYENLLEISNEINCVWEFNLEETQIENFFKKIDYLVIPSKIYETGPFVAHEALAHNTPVLATNFGGQKELINDGVNGYLFENDENSLINLLNKISDSTILKIDENLTKDEKNMAITMIRIYNS